MQPHQPNFQFEVRLGATHDLAAVAALFAAHYACDLTSRDAGQAERLQKELAGVACGSTVLAVAEANGQKLVRAWLLLIGTFLNMSQCLGERLGTYRRMLCMKILGA